MTHDQEMDAAAVGPTEKVMVSDAPQQATDNPLTCHPNDRTTGSTPVCRTPLYEVKGGPAAGAPAPGMRPGGRSRRHPSRRTVQGAPNPAGESKHQVATQE